MVMVILTMMTLLLSSSSLWCLSAVAILPMDDEKRQCVNSKQGLHHITDDNGYTCDWFDVFPPTGCCPPEKAIEKRYGCSACDLAKADDIWRDLAKARRPRGGRRRRGRRGVSARAGAVGRVGRADLAARRAGARAGLVAGRRALPVSALSTLRSLHVGSAVAPKGDAAVC